MKERILHVISDLNFGGAQAVLYHLWPSLAKSGKYEFEICVLDSPGHFGEQLVAEGATVHCLGSGYKYNPGAVVRLRKLIRQRSYSIVHGHLFPELHMVSLAAKALPGVRLVYTEHLATNRRRTLGLAGKLSDKLAYGSYEQIVAVNSTTRQSFVEWLPELEGRVSVVENGVRTSNLGAREDRSSLLRELGLAPESDLTLMLFAGRLTYQKGVDVLLKALAQLAERNYLCLIAGDGEQRSQLETRAWVLGLCDRVRFLGPRRDVPRLLRQADCMILPSRYEGLPLIVLEAMANGCPIIATRVDGTAEVLRNEASALLVRPDDTGELAEAISRFIGDRRLRARLAERALADVEAYSAERNAERLIAVYDRVMGKTAAGMRRNG